MLDCAQYQIHTRIIVPWPWQARQAAARSASGKPKPTGALGVLGSTGQSQHIVSSLVSTSCPSISAHRVLPCQHIVFSLVSTSMSFHVCTSSLPLPARLSYPPLSAHRVHPCQHIVSLHVGTSCPSLSGSLSSGPGSGGSVMACWPTPRAAPLSCSRVTFAPLLIMPAPASVPCQPLLAISAYLPYASDAADIFCAPCGSSDGVVLGLVQAVPMLPTMQLLMLCIFPGSPSPCLQFVAMSCVLSPPPQQLCYLHTCCSHSASNSRMALLITQTPTNTCNNTHTHT